MTTTLTDVRQATAESPALATRHPGVDTAAAADAVARLLVALGRDPRDPHLVETPRRVAQAMAEMLTPQPFTLTTFPNDEHYDELVVVRDIPFHSLCRHHLLPFHGVGHIAYLPGERIVGLSKLARTLEHHARDLQVQERLTQQVANTLRDHLVPRGVGVVLVAEHECMALRGARVPGTKTVTSAVHGRLAEDPRTRAEFLALVGLPTGAAAARM
ncbi:MAG: GTP cyclohydrolase I [Georgenia sp.]